jgi:hypothetical protein
MKHKFIHVILILSILLSLSTVALAQEEQPDFDRFTNRELPASLADLKLEAPVELSDMSFDRLDPSLFFAEGESKVIVRLTRPSVAEQGLVDSAAVKARNNLRQQQSTLLNRVMALDPNARVIAQVQIVLNAVFIEIDASILPQLAADPNVLRIAPVGNYELDLTETVPYIGATNVHKIINSPAKASRSPCSTAASTTPTKPLAGPAIRLISPIMTPRLSSRAPSQPKKWLAAMTSWAVCGPMAI